MRKRKRSRTARPNIRLRQLIKPGLIRDGWMILANCAEHKVDWVNHTFTEYAIGFVSSGRGSFFIDGQPPQRVGPGTLFFVYPGPVFHYGPDPGTEWCEYHFGFNGPRFHQLSKFGFFEIAGEIRRLTNITALIVQFRELIAIVRRGRFGDNDRALLLAERLLLELYYNRVAFQAAPAFNKPVESIMQFCREHVGEKLDFRELAREHAMSYSSLRQSIRKLSGLGPAQYLTSLRCDAARKLLAETDQSVKEIGAGTGFDDPYTFSRIFKRNVGVSPRLYRRQTAVWSGRIKS